jgi:hypothetical protein
MFGTVPGLAAWADFSIVMDKSPQQISVFIIDVLTSIGAELAGSRSCKKTPPLLAFFSISISISSSSSTSGSTSAVRILIVHFDIS